MSLRTTSIKNGSSDDEKGPQPAVGRGVVEPYYPDAEDPLEENEVFKKTHGGVDFRTVGWPRASVIFLKGMWAPKCFEYQLTMLQSSSPLESSVFLQQCTAWVLLEVLCRSLAGGHSTPTPVLSKETSAILILAVIPSPTWQSSLAVQS